MWRIIVNMPRWPRHAVRCIIVPTSEHIYISVTPNWVYLRIAAISSGGKVSRERVIFFKRLRFIDYCECTRAADAIRNACATATANLLTVYRTYGTCYLRNHFVSTSAEQDYRSSSPSIDMADVSHVDVLWSGRQADHPRRKKDLVIGDSRFSSSRERILIEESDEKKKKKKHRPLELRRASEISTVQFNAISSRPRRVYRVILKFRRRNFVSFSRLRFVSLAKMSKHRDLITRERGRWIFKLQG